MQAIPASGWRTFLAWNTGSGNLEEVADAIVFDSAKQHDVTVCVKFYPGENGANRGMVNEITGWLISKALGIPQPEHAYLVQVPLANLPLPKAPWLKAVRKEAKHYWAFATIKMPAQSAALKFDGRSIPLLLDDIRKWDALPNAVALDEHIANTDRHLNNLLRLGSGNYALIDNGRLAVEGGETNWARIDLEAGRHYTNQLSSTWLGPDCRNNKDAGYALTAADSHPNALASVQDELHEWWERLIPDPADRAAFSHFVGERSRILSTLLKTRFHLIA